MTRERSCLGVIPARAASTRFPNKIVAPILGKPMIQHVWEAACRSRRLTSLVVATDSEAIAAVVRGFGGEAVLTGECASGTDRVAQVALSRGAELIINLQGDEPLLPAEAIDGLIEALESNERAGMATLVVACPPGPDLQNPNVVKAVLSKQGEALYFSRQPLVSDSTGAYFKHVGIYGFRRDVLLRFREWGPSALETAERLEQLRALENGVRIQAVRLNSDTIAVDRPEDIAKVEAVLKARGTGKNGIST